MVYEIYIFFVIVPSPSSNFNQFSALYEITDTEIRKATFIILHGSKNTCANFLEHQQESNRRELLNARGALFLFHFERSTVLFFHPCLHFSTFLSLFPLTLLLTLSLGLSFLNSAVALYYRGLIFGSRNYFSLSFLAHVLGMSSQKTLSRFKFQP